ncbi:MAG: acyltransferase family protein [Acidimicrobiales bacterium]
MNGYRYVPVGRHFATSDRRGQRHAGGQREHLAGLDGLRGLAVAGVVAYHLGFGWAKGGFLGVDTFLVLSGYLITAGMLSEYDRTGGVSLRAFWVRRIRRLFPALVVVLCAAGLFAATWALPDQRRSLRLDILSALAFGSNWRFIASSQGYFGQAAAPSLVRHTWSLAVEAQLYVVWPLVVVGACRLRARRVLLAAVALGTMSAVLAAVLFATGGVTRAYYGTDTRAAAFLAGAAVAAVVSLGPRAVPTPRWAGVGGAAGIVGTAAAWTRVSGSSPSLFTGLLPLAYLCAAAVVAAVVVAPVGFVARVLSHRLLCGLGRVSYGVYLWHWPIILVLDHARTGLFGPALLLLRLAATGTATALSWLVIERPVLALGPMRLPRRWQPALGITVCASVVAGVLLPSSAGAARAPHRVASRAGDGAPVAFASQPPDPTRVLVLGDSVAVTLADAVKAYGPDYGADVHNGAVVGCGVAVGSAVRTQGDVGQIPGRCQGWERLWQDAVDAVHPDVVLVLVGRWEVLDRVVDGRWQHIGQPDFDAYLAGQLDRALRIGRSGGARVIALTAPYFASQERPQGGRWPEDEPARVDRVNGLLRQEVSLQGGMGVYDLNAAVSPGAKFASVLDGVVVRSSDGVHFSPESGGFLAPRLFPIVTTAGHAALDGGERGAR